VYHQRNIGFLPSAGNSTVIKFVSIFFQPLSSLVIASVDSAAAGYAIIGRANDASKIARSTVENVFLQIFKLIHQNKLRKGHL
jgi:hypothetical protein